MKAATEYTSQERAEIYNNILQEEMAKIKPQATGITRGQKAAAKGRASRKFFGMGF